jgi:hypothetical protein
MAGEMIYTTVFPPQYLSEITQLSHHHAMMIAAAIIL